MGQRALAGRGMCNGASNSGASLASGSCIVRYRSFNCLQCFLKHLDHGGASRLLCSSAAERLSGTARDARDYAINQPISLTCRVVAFKQMATNPLRNISAAERAALVMRGHLFPAAGAEVVVTPRRDLRLLRVAPHSPVAGLVANRAFLRSRCWEGARG